MDRTGDLLPFHYITSDNIFEVLNLKDAQKGIFFYKDRERQFRSDVAVLTEEGKWLLTFCVWFCMHNTNFLTLDASNFYSVQPSSTNEVTFIDFIKLIQKYRKKKVITKNEVHLIRFLTLCDKTHFDFYLSLLSKKFANHIPTAEVYDLLDLGSIQDQEIYGSIEMLDTNFSDLTYPVAIFCVPDPVYKISVHSQEPKRTFSYVQHEGKLKATKNFMTVDSSYINTPRYTIVGYSDVKSILRVNRKIPEVFNTLIPIDYFSNYNNYSMYMKGRRRCLELDFKQRFQNLKHFMDNNYTRQISRFPMNFAENRYELTQKLFEMLPEEGLKYLVLTDKDTARTGRSFAIPIVNTYGIIEDVWVSDGSVKGFNVWFNGDIIQCPFSFTGANNTLLSNIELTYNRMIELTYLKLGDMPIYIGNKIDWEKKRWKMYRHKGYSFIEKCALCGGTESPHKRQGLCKACEHNIRLSYQYHGKDTWIPQTFLQRIKRHKSGWSHEMLTNVKVFFRDTYLVGRSDGSWMFQWDATRAEIYAKYLREKENNDKAKLV